jgi:flagellar hook-associated protein 1 FlgK
LYISTFTPLDSALSGILAAQQELETTSNNIANSDTPGYTDESVNLSESLPLTVASDNGAGVQVGTGVDVSSISSARNQFLDAAYRVQNAVSNSATTEQSYLDQVQTQLNEPSTTGISSQLSKFWGAWNALAANPGSSAAAQTVVSDGQTLASSFNQLSTDLTTIQTNAASQYSSLTGTNGQVMTDAAGIVADNTAIQQAQAAGENPNQLQDQQNQLIDDLSGLANISVSNGVVGSPTVNSAMVNITLGDVSLVTVSATGSAVNADWAPSSTVADVGGTIGGLMNVAGTAIPGGQPGRIDGYLTALYNVDSPPGVAGVEQTLESDVNSPTVNGTPTATNNFFTLTAPSPPDVPALLAVSVTASQLPTTDAGNADVAAAIASLSGGPADQAYDGFVSQVGSDAQSADSTATTQQALTTAVSNQRQSVEGVDLSQEETNVIQEQQAYQASASVMNAFNTMIGSLLGMVGVS